MAETPPPTLSASPAPPAPPAAKWFDGKVDAELAGHISNKGWADKDVAEVAISAIKSHREAEKYIGAPADKLIRLPADANDVKGWDDVWAKLGAPADKAGYDFSGIKGADGKPIEGKVIDTARDIAAQLKLPKDVATRFAERFVKIEADRLAEEDAVRSGKLAEQKAALAKNWGPNEAINREIARNAAAKLGVQPDVIDAMENMIGYDKVMEAFRAIGVATGEAKFVTNPQNNPTGVMSKDEAQARLNDLKADKEWTNRYLNGGAAEKREMGGLMAILTA